MSAHRHSYVEVMGRRCFPSGFKFTSFMRAYAMRPSVLFRHMIWIIWLADGRANGMLTHKLSFFALAIHCDCKTFLDPVSGEPGYRGGQSFITQQTSFHAAPSNAI